LCDRAENFGFAETLTVTGQKLAPGQKSASSDFSILQKEFLIGIISVVLTMG